MCWKNDSDPSGKKKFFGIFHFFVIHWVQYNGPLQSPEEHKLKDFPDAHTQTFSEVNYEIQFILQWTITYGEVFHSL